MILSIRHAMRRPQRKPPQLLKVPFYDRAEALFRERCPAPLIGLELERTPHFGRICWVITAYSGPRNSQSISVANVMPGDIELTWDDVRTAIITIAQASTTRWLQRENMRNAREKLERDLQQAGERSGDVPAGVPGARSPHILGR